MPRSKRRKGVPPRGSHRFKGFSLDRPKAYYDPGSKPQPRNTIKDLNRKPYKPKSGRGG